MKPTEFISRIQDYYGAYNRTQLRELARYLYNAPENYLDALYQICLLQYSSKWKAPPDIAVLEGMKQDALVEAQKKLPKREYLEIEDDDSEEYISREEGQKFFEELTNYLLRVKTKGAGK